MTTNTRLYELLNGYKLEELKKALEENIREEAAKKAGTKANILTIVKRLITSTNDFRFKSYHPFDFDGKALKGFLNGYYLLASTNDFGYEPVEENNRFDCSRCLIGIKDATNSLEVDRADIKAFIKLHPKKDNTPYIIDFEDKKIAVNPRYLIDCLDFVGTDVIKFADIKGNSLKSPVYIENGDNYALLCTINLK